ncbi:hypothetical protein [Longimicrobium sp.]|uniref:hypothetical protein n=1 Tax=Longimicrobium sp. TaxID=2029185 RepID=UPI002E31D337|nr:hypothetical protein [Longimicrobium sp.]HEX6036544.1 hypothetical protein [Longimicrobium sp.]
MQSEPDARQGRRELAAIITAAVLLQVLIGTVATVRGDVIAWPSLLHRPLTLCALWIAALVIPRVGLLLLTGWFAFLAVMYACGGFVAGYATLAVLRWTAAVFLGWGTARLVTSARIRALRGRAGPG